MVHIDKEFLYPAAATVCALVGAGFDIRSRRIPNFVTGPGILCGILLHLALDGWHGLLSAAGGMLVCGIVFLIFHLAGGMGAGDVKLIAAVGCLGGIHDAASLLVLTSLTGGVMGLALAAMRGRLKSTLFNVVAITNHHTSEGLKPHPDLNVLNPGTLRLPYGVAIAMGSFVTLYFQGIAR